jgi:DNA invertase Pin-like site-specific DNA recombinase
MLDDLRSRGVRFQSLTEAIDTETPPGRAMWQMLGILAELERNMIAERTRAGAAAARARGVKFGRKPKLSPEQVKHARKMVESGEPVPKVAELLGVERTTIYRTLRRAEGSPQ